MRCYECGYQNQSDVNACVKCGTKLTMANVSGQSESPAATTPETGHAATMRGRAASAPAWDANETSQKAPSFEAPSGVIKCGACGYYPLRSEPAFSSPCVNCGFKGAEKAKEPEPDSVNGQPNSPSRPAKPDAVPGAKTVRIGQVNLSKEAPKPKLVLVDETTGTPLKFEGDEISLNRAALDPGNSSISSGEHARFSFKNGSWLIEDCSSNSATFIQVKDKMPVEDGTFIIVGDKVYRVELPETEK